MNNKNKFSIKAETDKNFERELEKASQAIYKLPYDSLQELPGDGKPSKHYLRKQYIKNKKFIGLPEDLKQLSNTLIYKSEQAELILDAYKTLKKKIKIIQQQVRFEIILIKKLAALKITESLLKKYFQKII